VLSSSNMYFIVAVELWILDHVKAALMRYALRRWTGEGDARTGKKCNEVGVGGGSTQHNPYRVPFPSFWSSSRSHL
jgi:hypothetical protein